MSPQSSRDSAIATTAAPSLNADTVDTSGQALIIDEQRLALVEETLRLDKRVIETGRVRVRSVVEEEPVVLRRQLEQTRVEVVHVPVDRVVDRVPAERTVDGVQILSVVEERFRLVRELVLVEEVHISRVVSTEPFETTATRRTMRAVVERDPIHPQHAEKL